MADPPSGAGGYGLRILMVSPSLEKTGGVANYVRVTRAHSSHRIEVAVRGSRPGERASGGAGVRLLRDYAAFAALLLRARPDVVHQNTSFGRAGVLRDAVVAAMAMARGCPLVIFFHGWDRAFEARLGRAELALLRGVYFRADAIVVLAERSRDLLRAWGYRGPVHLETTLVEDELLEVGRARPAPRGGPLRILYMARLERAKGIYDAIDVFLRLRARGVEAELLVAGDGSEREASERYAAERGAERVRFLGHVTGPEKAETLAQADVYLLTSHGEGMPTTVLEAMACGLPVVTSAVGGLPDLFEDGRMGYMVPPGDPGAFADALARLAGDPALRDAMGEHNVRAAAERFAASRVVARLGAIYEEAAGRAGFSIVSRK